MERQVSEGPVDYTEVPHNKLREVLLQKASELFVICDKEDKGSITKEDMQNLKGELPLTLEQLNEVFDALDDDHNGSLSLDEFTDGFGMFLGIDTKRRRLSRTWDDEPVPLSQELLVSSIPEEDGEEFKSLLNTLGAENVFEDEDYIREVWEHLRKDNPEILKNFEDFLTKVATDLSETRRVFFKLESTLKSRTNLHDEQVHRLYQEMEEQLTSANEEMLAKEKSRERKVRQEMETELSQKDKQLQEILFQHAQMEERLKQLNSGEAETKYMNVKLQKEKELLERRLGESEKVLMGMREYLDNLNKEVLEERRRRAQAAMNVSEGIALEREGLVKQLDLLRTVNRKLLDEKDEIADLSKRRQPEPGKVNQLGEAMTNYVPTDQSCAGPERRSSGFSEKMEQSDLETKPQTHRPGSVSVDIQTSWKDEEECEVDDQFYQAGSLTHSTPLLPNATNDFNVPPDHRKVIHVQSDLHVDKEDCEVDDQFFQVMGQGTVASLSNNFDFPKSGRKVTNTQQTGVSDDENTDEAAVMRSECVVVNSVKPIPRPRTHQLNTERSQDSKPYKKRGSIANPERLFKVVFMGDSGVGKTSFIHRFCYETFKGTFSATVGVDFQVKSLTVDGRLMALQLWDTAGQERFRSITKQYYRKADGIVIMYDVTSEVSFKNVRNWIANVKEGADERVVLMLIGNKTDLCESDEDRVVKTKDGNWLADEFGTLFYEVSARTGDYVSEAMVGIASVLQEKEDEEIEKSLQLQSTDIRRKKCC